MKHRSPFNRLTEKLGIDYPIIQGPFGGGISTVELLTTVSNAGGMGSYGAHILPPEGIKKLIADIRTHTNNPFALNLWVSDHDQGGLGMTEVEFNNYLPLFTPFYDQLNIAYPTYNAHYTERYEAQVEAIIEASPPVFSFVYGIPTQDILARCRARNILTIGTATTVDEAIAIEAAGVDIVLATGFEAGGHRVSFLDTPENSLIGTFALIPQVVDAVNIPVIAAGGISDIRGINAALALGAQAVQMGTAFLACEESGTSDLHRQSILSTESKHTRLSRAFTGRLARFITNDYIDAIEATPDLPLPFPLQSVFSSPIKLAANEQLNTAFASLYAGQSAQLLTHRHALTLMESLIAALDTQKPSQF